MRILILTPDPASRSVLASSRSLKNYNHEIHILSYENKFQNFQRILKSRFFRNVEFCPDPEIQPKRFVNYVKNYAEKENMDVLLPFCDEVTALAVYHKDELPVEVPLPKYETFQKAIDKLKTVELARKIKIPHPKTISEENKDSILNKIDELDLSFPLVLKPRTRGRGIIGAKKINTENELVKYLNQYKKVGKKEPLYNYKKPLIQEYVAGKIHDCCTLSEKGELKAGLTQIRLIGRDSIGGAGAVNITTKNPEIIDYSKKILKNLNWKGPAQLEWRYDKSDDKYKLLEINPRFWGTTSLSIIAGINFPLLTMKMLNSGLEKNIFNYRVGIKQRWLYQEFMSIFTGGNFIERITSFFNPRNLIGSNIYTDFDYKDVKPEIYKWFFRTVSTLLKA